MNILFENSVERLVNLLRKLGNNSDNNIFFSQRNTYYLLVI